MQEKFFIEIIPFPQARPRISKFGTYDPSKKKKKKLGLLIYDKYRYEPTELPVALDIIFHMPIPKSSSKKSQKELLGTPYLKKKDIDNLVKSTLDSMTGIVFKDDCQVWQCNAKKIYSDVAGIEISITIYE